LIYALDDVFQHLFQKPIKGKLISQGTGDENVQLNCGQCCVEIASLVLRAATDIRKDAPPHPAGINMDSSSGII